MYITTVTLVILLTPPTFPFSPFSQPPLSSPFPQFLFVYMAEGGIVSTISKDPKLLSNYTQLPKTTIKKKIKITKKQKGPCI
jgi:hypothetical protein